MADLTSPQRLRFPTFWGPGFDWTPDHNWGGSGMIALEEMLLQTPGDRLLLLPSWPTNWDVDCKLNAPRNTVVECIYRKGELRRTHVSPKERSRDLEAWKAHDGVHGEAQNPRNTESRP